MSTALGNGPLGFEHVAKDLWPVLFKNILLGRVRQSEARLIIGAGQ